MTPKQQAKEIYNKFYAELYALTELRPRVAKRCASAAVWQIIVELNCIRKPEYTTFIYSGEQKDGYEVIDFWTEVKQEIEKL